MSEIHLKEYNTHSLSHISNIRAHHNFYKLIKTILLFLLVLIFVPWTQNVDGEGFVIPLQPQDRPQSIPSIITGKIEQWYIKEGQFVKKGDTIIRISEAKDEYFDPYLVKNTANQLEFKRNAVKFYTEKANALEMQIVALRSALTSKLNQLNNKLQQAKMKLAIDSSEYLNAKVNLEVANAQVRRFEDLYKEGLKSLTELEGRRLKQQEAINKYNAAINKISISQQDIINTNLEISATQAEYNDKIAKAEAEKFSALSSASAAEADIAKLQSLLNTYTKRTSYYYITAPKDCYIVKAVKLGVGEIIKEGTPVVDIVPSQYEVAAALYISPRDYPIVHIGDKVRVQFDGYPSLVFGGWPNASLGTYRGRIVAIDKNISNNNKYRVLVVPEKNEEWPAKLAINSGCKGIILLKDVLLGYEIWRQLNGFPPKYYEIPEGKNYEDYKKTLKNGK